MDLLKEFKMLCLENDINLQILVDKYNNQYQYNLHYNSFHRKLKDGTLKHTEYRQLMDVLGYEIVWRKKE